MIGPGRALFHGMANREPALDDSDHPACCCDAPQIGGSCPTCREALAFDKDGAPYCEACEVSYPCTCDPDAAREQAEIAAEMARLP